MRNRNKWLFGDQTLHSSLLCPHSSIRLFYSDEFRSGLQPPSTDKGLRAPGNPTSPTPSYLCPQQICAALAPEVTWGSYSEEPSPPRKSCTGEHHHDLSQPKLVDSSVFKTETPHPKPRLGLPLPGNCLNQGDPEANSTWPPLFCTRAICFRCEMAQFMKNPSHGWVVAGGGRGQGATAPSDPQASFKSTSSLSPARLS